MLVLNWIWGLVGSLTEFQIIKILSYYLIVSALITMFSMLKLGVRASYGRYSSESIFSKYSVPATIAWFIQELPSLVLPLIAVFQVVGIENIPLYNLIIVAMFTAHYFHRTIIYSFLIRGGKPTPIHLMVLGIVFCLWNGYIQGFYHAKYARYDDYNLWSLRTIFGMAIFVSGMAINCHSDSVLRNLRGPGESGYKIPHGGLFKWVSGANFFGEIFEWFGYAIFANSTTAWAFAMFTMANTIPRALCHHDWYLKKFENYPKNRKAVIPYLI